MRVVMMFYAAHSYTVVLIDRMSCFAILMLYE